VFARFATSTPPGSRLMSLDAYRGFIMLAMASGGLAIPGVVRAMAAKSPTGEVPGIWQFLAFHTDHVTWTGCSFWDLIQPSFMFMVGVALPYSFASRKAKGDSLVKIYAHAFYRSVLLILLGIFLSSSGSRQTNFTFVNVLTQIGLGYFFLYFLIGRGLLVQGIALLAILGGYGAWFYSHPLPGPDFAWTEVGLLGPYPWQDGLFAHWNMNSNAASAFDTWFLNLFPQPARVTPTWFQDTLLLAPERWTALTAVPFVHVPPRVEHAFFFNSGGYATLNFIPSLGTMLLGLMAGELLRSLDHTNIEKFIRLVFIGFVFIAAGWVLGETVCPLVKRIWTPSWTIYSTGFTFLMLAGFYLVIDMWGYQRWAWPLIVVGMNSIAIYCMAQLLKGWIASTVRVHFGPDIFNGTYFGRELFSDVYAPIARSVVVLFVMWLVCVWMYRQKIFVKI
jgi:predicted acyltransferase